MSAIAAAPRVDMQLQSEIEAAMAEMSDKGVIDTPSRPCPPSPPPPSPPLPLAVPPPKTPTISLVLQNSHLRPLTRLWLASRVRGPRKVDVDDASDAESVNSNGDGDEKDPASEKASTLLTPPTDNLLSLKYSARGRPRPFTLANLGIAASIARQLWPRVVGIVVRRPVILGHVGVYILGTVVGGVMPAAALWASSKLLDLVQMALTGRPATWPVALKYAGMAVAFTSGVDLQALVFAAASATLQRIVSTASERAYISAKLDLAQHTAPNPIQRDLVYEAGVFAGKKDMSLDCPPWGPWEWVNQLSYATSAAIDIATKIYLLVDTVRAAGQQDWSDSMTWSNGVLIALSLAPVATSMCHNWLWERYNPYAQDLTPEKRKQQMEGGTLNMIIENDNMRNELVLFSLKNWALKKWDALQATRKSRDDEHITPAFILLTLFQSATESMAHNIFYLLLATRAIQTNMSLGSIHVHQRLGEALINSMRQFGRTITFAYQVPFLLAASFSAAEGPESVVPTVDYDDYREARGMHIQVSGLCFAYSKDPVLKNIHLDITPGESLAVVGFNGSGKTTFVKTLLGLHNHTGSLAINGRDIRDYNPESLHRRMSCLFQDYAKYDLRLRDNVGLGDTTRMDQTDLLNTSIERGGATAIRDQYGLDVWLNGSRPGLATNFINDEGIGIVKNRNSMRRTNIIYREGDPEEPEEPASNPADSDDDSDSSVCSDAFITTGLSGGQWQRVALARAFMRADTADLIVFDEPSASLDPRAEAELFDRIHSLAHGSGATTIFISHRFNTVRRADRIAFMDQGRIVEYGSHDELMELKGKYFECFDLQRKGFQ